MKLGGGIPVTSEKVIGMDDLLNEFLTETFESIEVVDLELVELEKDPNNKSVLDNIFRLVHTIKGTCGFLGLPRLEAVAHSGENVLGKFRDGEMKVTPEAVTLILTALDRIKEILVGLEQNQQEPSGDDSEIINQLNAMAEGNLYLVETPKVIEEAPIMVSDVRPSVPGEVTLDELEAAFLAAPGPDDEDPVEEAVNVSVQETVKAAEVKKEEVVKANGSSKEGSIANQSIRVTVDVLDNLMNMVSELVLTRNQLMQISRRTGESEFAIPLQRLSQCTTELQEGVMKTRMQPIGNAWSKLPRIIRDLQMELGKKIDLQMLGADTELDRQVLELIKDPLTHMIRNSADHGIEKIEDRIAAGKKETGTIRLNAFHEGGQIIIEISDDGAGLSVEKLKAKALSNGLATEEELAEMSDQQIQRFIFHAGFSTAAKVTSVSGRGVGMDVVRSNIEKIGGAIELKSTEGKGTTFLIKIPLTLAIVSALIVESGTERFAIPQISVLELVRASGDSNHKIEYINSTPVLRLRDRLLPLLHLNKILGFEEGDNMDADSLREDFIIITQVGDFTFGIVVDRVFDTEEIVVKPVAPILRDLNVFSGNTILGDGTVIMILDPNGIASEANEAMSELSDQRAEEEDDVSRATFEDKEAILLFRAGGAPWSSMPTTDGNSSEPSMDSNCGAPARTIASTEFVVPRSMPIIGVSCVDVVIVNPVNSPARPVADWRRA